MMKKNIFLAIFALFCFLGAILVFNQTHIQNLLEQTVEHFDAKGGQIFIINAKTQNIEKVYKVGESNFSPFKFTDKSECFLKPLSIGKQSLDSYACTHIKKHHNQVEAISFANLFSIGKNYEVWVVLNEPKPKKETFGFVTAPWNAWPLLTKIIKSL